MKTVKRSPSSRASRAPRLVGVVHLPPLPGSPRARGDASALLDAIALSVTHDVVALTRAGFDAVIVENFGDAPFMPGSVEPITVAAMTRCVRAACEAGKISVGVNVLRNDALSAIAVAVAAGASFVRINVHVGAVVADQGIIEGRAHQTLRARRAWGADAIDLWTDVAVKHAAPLAPRPPLDEAHDAVLRGLADAVLVTGKATGSAADPKDVARLHEGLHGTPIYVASGTTPDELPALAAAGAHGVVVGSWLRTNGRAGGAIDPRRSASFAKSFRRAFQG